MQSSISNNFLSTGIPGEFSRSYNQMSRGAILNSAVEANNIVGRVVLTVDGNDFEVGVAADGNFAGVLISPKTAIRQTLEAQAFVSNDIQVEVAESGYLFVSLTAAAKNGDFVYFSDTDGSLATAAPATTAPAGHSRLPGGLVKGLNVSGAGTGEIYFDMTGSVAKTA
tara:strand:+ start:1664 stop:2167 length:504 start_codon:yes stop_codon:yes gene_type:complete